MAVNVMTTIGLSAAAIAALGGSAGFVAEGAVPGDALYVLKTGVNDRVVAAVNAESQADAEARLAERRMEELRTLQSEGRLTADLRADMARRIDAHLDEAASALASADASLDAEASARITAAIDAARKARDTAFVSVGLDAGTSASADAQSASAGAVHSAAVDIQHMLDGIRIDAEAQQIVETQSDGTSVHIDSSSHVDQRMEVHTN